VAAASGPIGLGDDGEEYEVRTREEMLESGNSELRGAAEEDSKRERPAVTLS
jgi:hypothetical protein